MSYSENQVLEMLMSRLDVIKGRVQEMQMVLESAKMTGGEVEIEPWMVDKITLAADYISAAADNTVYGDGVEVESSYSEPQMDNKQKETLKTYGYSEEAINAIADELEARYGEKKGLWHNIHQKRKRIKAGSGERMRKPGEKGAPSQADLKAAQGDD